MSSDKFDAFISKLNAKIASHSDAHMGPILRVLHTQVERDLPVILGHETDPLQKLLSTMSITTAFTLAAIEAIRNGDVQDTTLSDLTDDLFELLGSTKRA